LLAGESSGYDRAPSLDDIFASGISSPPRPPCRCEEYSFRVADLESRLSLMKRQAQVSLDKASKSHGLVRQVSDLEDKVLGLVARKLILRSASPFFLVLSSLFARCYFVSLRGASSLCFLL
jgi:hypothetical protein